MAIDLSVLSSATNSISQLSGAILAIPKVKGFEAKDLKTNKFDESMVFSIESNNTITLNSDITDHVVEDNTVINDQIAVKPEIYMVKGFIGELQVLDSEALRLARVARDRLVLLQEFVPELTINAIRAYNIAEQTLRLADNLSKSFNDGLNSIGQDVQTNQQKFYTKIRNYWKKKTLFKIQTPWTTMDNMAIQILKVIQDDKTESISDFEITFKQITFASTTFTSEADLEKRLGAQGAEKSNNGNISTVDSNVSVRVLAA